MNSSSEARNNLRKVDKHIGTQDSVIIQRDAAILNLKRELHLKKKEALVLRGLTEEAQFLVAGVRANSWLRRATTFLQEPCDE